MQSLIPTQRPSPRPSPGVPGEGAILRRALGIFLLAASSTFAQTTRPTLSASLGFAGVFKPDSWTPVYVRVADADAPRSATLELRTARGKLGHDLVTRIATTNGPSTYTLYAPIGALDRVTLQLRDGNGRLLQTKDLTDAAQQTPAALGGPALGVAGEPAAAQRVVNQLVNDTGEYVAAGAIAARLLPERVIGYAAIDALVLPALDADAIDVDVQQAIVSWVRSGGVLITWPGAQGWTRDRAPLVVALPAEVGDPQMSTFEGHDVAGRHLAAHADAVPLDDRPKDASAILEGRLGLGQIVLLAFDPTQLPNSNAADRVALWRQITSKQISMSQDDRRVGVFDPLVTQAVGEQQLAAIEPTPPSATRKFAAVGLLVGLLLGPGELLLLAAARRHPRTWYTVSGLALCVGCGSWWLAVASPRPMASDARIDVRIEAPDGLAAAYALATHPDLEPTTTWLTADRTDPSLQPATELNLAQREADFDVTGLTMIGDRPAKVRSLRFSGEALHPAHIGFDRATSLVTNNGPKAWAATAIVQRDGIRISNDAIAVGGTSPVAAAAMIAADNPATRRIETGIERLAGEPGWAAILMDRRLSERLVRLLEAEDAAVIATRDAGGTSFTLQVVR